MSFKHKYPSAFESCLILDNENKQNVILAENAREKQAQEDEKCAIK